MALLNKHDGDDVIRLCLCYIFNIHLYISSLYYSLNSPPATHILT